MSAFAKSVNMSELYLPTIQRYMKNFLFLDKLEAMTKKRVLLLIIDALTAPCLLEEMANGRYPNFQKLNEAGTLREQCVSIFPSITHAALTSIITGQYPAKHGIIASHWYDAEAEKIVYFSGSLGVMLEKGLGNYFKEFLLEMNNNYLQVPTLFQKLERNGRKTASINFPVYRGDVPHNVNAPLLLEWIPNLPTSTTVKGPEIMLMGDLLADPDNLEIEANYTGITEWFGFRDENSADLVLQLAETDEFPDFTLAYFPENDDRAHNDGPTEAHKNLADMDEMLGDLFAAYGGLDDFLQKFALVITGDHSQSATTSPEDEEGIDLAALLSQYSVAQAGDAWDEEDDLIACPNLRAAHLYLKTVTAEAIEGISEQLLAESRIDQILYRAEFVEAGEGYIVRTDQGQLRFWHDDNRDDKDTAHDRHDNQWAWEGDLAVVDGRLQDNQLTFPDYPNAFERIAGALDSETSGHIWITAKIGHELMIPEINLYAGGGSHASLHKQDSQAPLFVAGAPSEIDIPSFPRIIDVAPLCAACLGA
ncbi:MAG: hypothetical protein CL608_07605 [Anaerolineaceae bacterium]|nr:hypothetical protein [Anaerolineaceae bacterium]